MEISIVIILLALVQYLLLTLKVGKSREKYKVLSPKTVGDETWERMFRIQQNTLEQLVVFIPGMLIFSHYVSSLWVVLPGVLFLIGRQVFAIAYFNEPKSRTLGFALTFFSNVGLVVAGLIGVIVAMFA
ncbi:MAPEG family protein [Shewanella sp.]|uniref:MAPEG family protein n=1 Tax=Shewanella sp. TaxID=50422 RepID=UPI001EC3B7F8|nr:MAPEG family protein [Shewanella sp.]NRB22744.1 MAPEG family protein [Shewanella sp.]